MPRSRLRSSRASPGSGTPSAGGSIIGGRSTATTWPAAPWWSPGRRRGSGVRLPLRLAGLGARVVITGRDQARTERAAAEIAAASGSSDVHRRSPPTWVSSARSPSLAGEIRRSTSSVDVIDPQRWRALAVSPHQLHRGRGHRGRARCSARSCSRRCCSTSSRRRRRAGWSPSRRAGCTPPRSTSTRLQMTPDDYRGSDPIRPRQARPGDAQRAVGGAVRRRTSCSTRCIRDGPTRLACEAALPRFRSAVGPLLALGGTGRRHGDLARLRRARATHLGRVLARSSPAGNPPIAAYPSCRHRRAAGAAVGVVRRADRAPIGDIGDDGGRIA